MIFSLSPLRFFLTFSLLLFVLTGCGGDVIKASFQSLTAFQTSKVWLDKVYIQASKDVNDTAPVPLEIILFYDEDLMKRFQSMTARDYFGEQGEQLKADNVGKFEVIFQKDIIRGERSEHPIKPSSVSGVGILVFADYDTPGRPHRASIGKEEKALIELNKLDFKVKPL